MKKALPRSAKSFLCKICLVLVSLVSLLFSQGTTARVFAISVTNCPKGMSGLDCNALYGPWTNWVPYAGCGSAATAGDSGTATAGDSVTYLPQVPSGSDPEQQIYNFFVSEVHLNPAAAAGIMGNIQAESHFNPADAQTARAWTDMSSRNINQGGGGGVGLVQWDGGRRPAYINYAKSHGADPKNIVPQLNYIWNELNTGYKNVLAEIQGTTDPGQAAYFFHRDYEISADSPAKIQGRMDNAKAILAKYSGTADSSTTDSSNCAANDNTLSPECAAASGRARIICAAKLYDPVSYREDGTTSTGHGSGAEWHSKYCPVIGPSCFLDCSGLVDIAIYDVYGVSLAENTGGERDDIGQYWQKISFSQIEPGDIMQPNQGHVVVIDHVTGNTLYTFAAHTASRPQPLQVGPSNYTKSSAQLYLRYIGPGSS